MKNYILTLIVTTALFLLATPLVHASNLGAGNLLRTVDKMQMQASRSATAQGERLSVIISRANEMISIRITALNKLNMRIQNDLRLSSDEKTLLTSDMQTTIDGLTALKTKIDADTDTTTAMADRKQIVTNYYVYAIFDPKIRLLIVLNNLQTVVANIQALVPQLQNLMTTFQSQGKDVTQLQTLFTDMNIQIQTINTTLLKDITNVQNVSTRTSPTDAQVVFSQVKQDISQILKPDLEKIRTDISQMRPIFRQLILTKELPSAVSISPTTKSL